MAASRARAPAEVPFVEVERFGLMNGDCVLLVSGA
jgi:hypothetical protein